MLTKKCWLTMPRLNFAVHAWRGAKLTWKQCLMPLKLRMDPNEKQLIWSAMILVLVGKHYWTSMRASHDNFYHLSNICFVLLVDLWCLFYVKFSHKVSQFTRLNCAEIPSLHEPIYVRGLPINMHIDSSILNHISTGLKISLISTTEERLTYK